MRTEPLLTLARRADVAEVLQWERDDRSAATEAIVRTRRDGSAVDVVGAARAQLLGWAKRGRGPAQFVTAGQLLRDHGDAALCYVSDMALPAALQRRVAGLLMAAGCEYAPASLQTTMEV